MKFLTALCLLFITPLIAQAKLKLPWFFSDNMVLQQQASPAIWGWTDKKNTVTVTTSWNNKKYTVQPDSKGKWKVAVATPKAGGPYEITISDGQIVKIKNILIGEVWICSGQSNMEMPLKGFSNQPINHSNDIVFNSTNDQIRLYNIPRSTQAAPRDTSKNFSWKISNPEDVANFSATGYTFGKFLYDRLKVPIGLINVSYGGTPVESFMDAASLREYGFPLPAPNDQSRLNNKIATVVYNGMLHPVIGYGVKGFIWYQGESNADRPKQYETLFPNFVQMLRSQFNQGDLPFYYVQIAPFDYNSSKKKGDTLLNSAFLRDAQRKALDKIPNSGMAVTMDIGDAGFIHPREKQEIGKRLALQALAKTYQYKGFASEGPLYESMTIKEGKAIVKFKNAPVGLTSYGKPITQFEIAGEDQKFYPATAQLVNGAVEISSKEVKNPVAVRYAFKDDSTGELFNTAGFPASSFRTDDWEIPVDVK
ncbi:sialate O-acetylesterase [Niabella yanshanensis]|uniref:Sialate O-acetylesterase n=1 Tax=Niabella yanshanensis TaxID=577386 RepID=A0ABZ0W8C2_9BACT|nr:sialate O-acetylesterase [Niabella yanshanensis]WQD38848.1 sialate O-acetylesterase [Niabella yanshanensis]